MNEGRWRNIDEARADRVIRSIYNKERKRRSMESATTVAEAEVTTSKPKRTNILDKALLLTVSKSGLGLTKSVSSQSVEVETDKSALHIQKELFNSKELKAIFAEDIKLDDWLKTKCSPFPFRRGFFLIGVDLFQEVEAKLTLHSQVRKELIDTFIEVYDQAVIDAKARLNVLFNPADYPPASSIKALFDFEWTYLDFSISEKLKEVDKEVYDRKQAELEASYKEAEDVARQLLRARVKGLVDWMAERLTPTLNDDGTEKKKIFKAKSLDKINEFFTSLPSQDITNDDDLQKLVGDAKALLSGISPDALRSDANVRAMVADGFKAIQNQLTDMLTDAPSRSIRLSDDE